MEVSISAPLFLLCNRHSHVGPGENNLSFLYPGNKEATGTWNKIPRKRGIFPACYYHVAHKVRIYKGYHGHGVCPLVRIGTLPTPLSPANVPLPPRTGVRRAHSPAGEGLGLSQFRRLEKKLSTLPTL
jgi:hypothetical protein